MLRIKNFYFGLSLLFVGCLSGASIVSAASPTGEVLALAF